MSFDFHSVKLTATSHCAHGYLPPSSVGSACSSLAPSSLMLPDSYIDLVVSSLYEKLRISTLVLWGMYFITKLAQAQPPIVLII